MKIIYILLGLWNAINIGTLFYFAYRYIWFATETIPGERVFSIIGMLILGGVITGIVAGIHEIIKNSI